MIFIKRLLFIIIVFHCQSGFGQFLSVHDTSFYVCVKSKIDIGTDHKFDSTISYQLTKKSNKTGWTHLSDSLLVEGNSQIIISFSSIENDYDSCIYRILALDSNNQIIDSSRQYYIYVADTIANIGLSKTLIANCENSQDTIFTNIKSKYFSYFWLLKEKNSAWDTVKNSANGIFSSSRFLALKLDTIFDDSKLLLTSTNVCNTMISDTINVTVIRNTHIISSKNNVNGCSYDTVRLQYTVRGENLRYNWFYQDNKSWDTITNTFNNSNLIGAKSKELFIYKLDTQYYNTLIKIEITGKCGSVLEDTNRLNIIPNPRIISSPKDTVLCEGIPVSFSANISGFKKSYQWQVKTSGSYKDISSTDTDYINENTNQLTFYNNFNGDTSKLFRLKYSATCLDSGFTKPFNLQVLKKPRIHFFDSSIIGCEGEVSTVISKISGTNISRLWYLTTKKGQNLILNNQNYLGLFSKYNTDSLLINGLVGLLDSSKLRLSVSGTCTPDTTSNPILIIVDSEPKGILSANKNLICSKDSADVIFKLTSGNRLKYNWEYLGDKNKWYALDTSAIQFSILANGELKVFGADSNSSTTIRLSAENRGCGKYRTNEVSILTKKLNPLVFGLSKETICLNEQATLKINNFKELKILPDYAITQILNDSFLLEPKKSTSYHLEYKDKNDCKGFDTISIIVESLPNLDYFNKRLSKCIGYSGVIELTDVDTSTKINWLYSGKILSENKDELQYTTLSEVDSLKIIGTTKLGCKDSIEKLILSNPNPEIFISGDRKGCNDALGMFFATGADKYSWYDGDVLLDSSSNFKFRFKESLKTVKVEGENIFGCKDSVKVTIESIDNPYLNVNDITACKGVNTLLDLNTNAHNIEYFPTYGLFGNKDSLWFDGEQNMTYLISGINNFGCSITDTVRINVVNPISVNIPKSIKYCNNSYSIINIPYKGIKRIEWESIAGLDLSDTLNIRLYGNQKRVNKYHSIDTNNCSYFDSIISVPLDSPRDKILGDSVFCRNKRYLIYKATTDYNSQIFWQIQNAEIVKEGSNRRIFINAGNDSIILNLIQTIQYPEMICIDSVRFVAKPNNKDASVYSKIQSKKMGENKLLLIPINQNLNYYQWGKESKLNNIEIILSKNRNWHNINLNDTNEWAYWLMSGNDSVCLNKEYFTSEFTNSIKPRLEGGKYKLWKIGYRKLEIKNVKNIANLKIFNVNGQLVNQFGPNEFFNEKFLDVSWLKSGVYIFCITDNNNSNYVERLLIE